MLSCLSPRSPCWGPNAAASFTPACGSASSEWTSSRVTEAGCASSATRRPPSGLRSARSPTSRSMPNFIELQREGRRLVKVRLAGRMPQRPVRERAAGIFDHRRQPDPEFSRVPLAHAGLELEPSRLAPDANPRIGARERAALAIARERVGRPLAGGRKVVFVVATLSLARDEDLAAGVLPQSFGRTRRAPRGNAQPVDIAVEQVSELQLPVDGSVEKNLDAAQRRARCGGVAFQRGVQHRGASLSCAP